MKIKIFNLAFACLHTFVHVDLRPYTIITMFMVQSLRTKF